LITPTCRRERRQTGSSAPSQCTTHHPLRTLRLSPSGTPLPTSCPQAGFWTCVRAPGGARSILLATRQPHTPQRTASRVARRHLAWPCPCVRDDV